MSCWFRRGAIFLEIHMFLTKIVFKYFFMIFGRFGDESPEIDFLGNQSLDDFPGRNSRKYILGAPGDDFWTI